MCGVCMRVCVCEGEGEEEEELDFFSPRHQRYATFCVSCMFYGASIIEDGSESAAATC